MRNIYFVLRHGWSLANTEKMIVSSPDDSLGEWGLSEEGVQEVIDSVSKARDEGILDGSTIIASSDFLRTKETAETAARVLGASNIVFTPRLRERFFGNWDKTQNSNYQKVWDDDKIDHFHTHERVESVAEVLKRSLAFIEELERKYSGKKILIVSHGDTLQILQTAFEGKHPSEHRSLLHLKTGEVRRLGEFGR